MPKGFLAQWLTGCSPPAFCLGGNSGGARSDTLLPDLKSSGGAVDGVMFPRRPLGHPFRARHANSFQLLQIGIIPA